MNETLAFSLVLRCRGMSCASTSLIYSHPLERKLTPPLFRQGRARWSWSPMWQPRPWHEATPPAAGRKKGGWSWA